MSSESPGCEHTAQEMVINQSIEDFKSNSKGKNAL